MARYINIFKEKDGTRRISDRDWSNRGDAETFPIMDRELVTETVRILNEQEEKEFAWEWFRRGGSYILPAMGDRENKFEKEWKEQGR